MFITLTVGDDEWSSKNPSEDLTVIVLLHGAASDDGAMFISAM